MKKIAIFALVTVLALGLCACNMGGDEPTKPSDPATTPPATTPSEPAPTMPTENEPVIDPTLDTNVPDPSVDDEHLIEPTGDGTVMP